jgi:FAD/FMN-containing dehydrogenase
MDISTHRSTDQPATVPEGQMTITSSILDRTAQADFALGLRDVLEGRVVTPADPSWDVDRAAWNLSVDQRPIAVVLPASAADVVATVLAARSLGLRVAPQGTGHNAVPLGSLDASVLLRTSAMNGIEIDELRCEARVEAGALWGDVTDAAACFGLAALAGSSRDVGVVGYTLGGGLSWFGRSHGLAANQVTAAEVVTVDGRLVRIDAEDGRDLFWAIRGGGGSFAIVTALTFRLFPVTEVVAGALFWPIERAAEVLHCWRDLLADLAEEVTSIGRLLRFPPIPEIPEPMRGRSMVTVELVSQLDAAATDALLAPLRALRPELDTVGPTPVRDLGALHMDPPAPVPVCGDGMLLRELSREAIDAYIAAAGPSSGIHLLTSEIRHLGGALAPGRTAGGALSGLAGEALIFSGTMTPDADAAGEAYAAIDAIHCALAPWAAGTSYSNFAERPTTKPAFDAATLATLRALKATTDPADLIHANHPLNSSKH